MATARKDSAIATLQEFILYEQETLTLKMSAWASLRLLTTIIVYRPCHNIMTTVKKCPICFGGKIEFEGDSVGDYGECNNEQNHEDRYGSFEITKKEPFTVKYEQGPLHTYTVPARIPDWAFGEGGLKFSLRDNGNGSTFEEMRDAILLTLEGLSDWMSSVVDTIEWDGVDWDEYEEDDDGISEHVLEDVE